MGGIFRLSGKRKVNKYEVDLTVVRENLQYNTDTGLLHKDGHPIKYWYNNGYGTFWFMGAPYAAHRLIWFHYYGVWPTLVIDHINGNRIDNRICNLRDVSRRVNNQNTVKHRNGKLLGAIYSSRDRKWRASISIPSGGNRGLGYFDDEVSAHNAYIEASKNIDVFESNRDIKYKNGIPRGICYHKATGKWQLYPHINGKRVYIGIFHTVDEAIEALDTYKGGNA